MKTCTKCNVVKDYKEFYRDKYAKNGYYPSCKLCNKDRHKLYSNFKTRKAAYDKEYRKTLGFRKAANQFKVSVEFLENLHKSQNELCAICHKPEVNKHNTGVVMRLAIDHDHKTNKVRGFLCQKCNQGLGMFLDSKELLASAIDYLIKTQ